MQWLHVLADVGVETGLKLLNQLSFNLMGIRLTTNGVNDGNVKSISTILSNGITQLPVVVFSHSTLNMLEPASS